MQQLPIDTIGEILRHLDTISWIRFSRSCRRFYDIFATEHGQSTTDYNGFYQHYNYLYKINRKGEITKILDKTIVAYSRNHDKIMLMDIDRNLYLYSQGTIRPIVSKKPITQDLLLFANDVHYVSGKNIVAQTFQNNYKEQRAENYEVKDMFAGPDCCYFWLISKNTANSVLLSSKNEPIFHGTCKRLIVLRSSHYYYMLYIDDDGILHTMAMNDRKIKRQDGKKFVDLWLSANQGFAFLKDRAGQLYYIGYNFYYLDYVALEKVVKRIEFDQADSLSVRIFKSQFVDFKINRLAIWRYSYREFHHSDFYHYDEENREYDRGRVYYYSDGYFCYDIYKYYYIDEQHNLWGHIYDDRKKIAGYKFTDIISIDENSLLCLGTSEV